MTGALLPGMLLLLTAIGCNAFSEVADPTDGGKPNPEPSLVFSPNNQIRPGQTKEFTIAFGHAVPWTGKDTGGYLTDVIIRKAEFDAEAAAAQMDGLDDIVCYRNEYDGFQSIHSWCYAQAQGDYLHPVRILTIGAAFEEFGHPQQLHSEWGYLWVNTGSEESDGGTP